MLSRIRTTQMLGAGLVGEKMFRKSVYIWQHGNNSFMKSYIGEEQNHVHERKLLEPRNEK